MNHNYLLHLEPRDGANAKKVSDEINSLLNGKGLYVNYHKEDSTLYISIKPTLIKRKLSRNAGRKQGKVYTQYKCSEIAEMQKTMTNEQIATQLNIPKATFYRHLKLMKQHNDMSRLF
jgi:predicted HTH transcriptional regulator